MVLGLVPPPRHVDDLDALLRQERLVGLGMLAGGTAGGALWALGCILWSPGLAAVLLGAAVWGAVALLGLLQATVGASMAQARAARRLIRAPGKENV